MPATTRRAIADAKPKHAADPTARTTGAAFGGSRRLMATHVSSTPRQMPMAMTSSAGGTAGGGTWWGASVRTASRPATHGGRRDPLRPQHPPVVEPRPERQRHHQRGHPQGLYQGERPELQRDDVQARARERGSDRHPPPRPPQQAEDQRQPVHVVAGRLPLLQHGGDGVTDGGRARRRRSRSGTAPLHGTGRPRPGARARGTQEAHRRRTATRQCGRRRWEPTSSDDQGVSVSEPASSPSSTAALRTRPTSVSEEAA